MSMAVILGAARGRALSEEQPTAKQISVTLRSPRGLATRYDKHAIVCRARLVLAAVLLWLTDLGDTS